MVRDAKEIVPGDIILVGLGDLVPADAKIMGGELSVDQSALTGESLPVNLNPSDIVYSSSIVTRGEAKCVVVNTGVNTYFGRTAELVKTANRPICTHLASSMEICIKKVVELLSLYEEEFLKLFKDSKGLCIPYFTLLLKSLKNTVNN